MTAIAERPQVRFKLSAAQRTVFQSDARFRVLIAGRRFGKSYLACLILIQEALSGPDRTCWYVAPTYRQGKEILWATLKRLMPREYIAKTNETDLAIQLLNGSVIAIRGADNPDSLRGPGLHFAAFDKFAFMQREVWDAIIRPALAVAQGRGLFITTPNGMGWDYDLFMMGQDHRDGFASWTFTTLDGGNVTPEEVIAARSSMSARLFRQEFEASFEVLAGRVYDNFDRRLVPEGNVDASVRDNGAELLVGQDFNINPMASVIGVRAGDELHIIDAFEIQTSNTEEVATFIKGKYPGRRVIVCPDPSANQRRSSAAAGVTDITILKSHGFQVDASPHAILIPDRTNAVQAMLKDANGRRRLKVHPKAAALIRALDGQTYKDGTNIPDKKSGLDHIADALGYLVWQRFNLLHNRRATVQELFI